MPIIDTTAYTYISDNYRFADICNAVLFNGRQFVDPEQLKDADSKNVILAYGDGPVLKELKDSQRFRDVIKGFSIKTDGKLTYMVVGIENQAYINYGMPLKALLYDVLHYSYQAKQITDTHTAKGDYRTKGSQKASNDFLGGLTKEDKLTPVITIVIYFGTETWDAPTSFRGMFGSCPVEILEWLPEYKYHLVTPTTLSKEDLSKFHSDFSDVMEFIRLSKDKKQMKALLERSPRFKHLRIDTALLLSACTKLNVKITPGKEEIDMCQAFWDFKEEGRLEGKAEGKAEGRVQMLYDLVLDKVITSEFAAAKAQQSIDTFNAGLQAYAGTQIL